MKKLFDVTGTFFLAIRCSFRFCWRNEKWLTIGRILTTIVGAVLMYAAVVAAGYLVNVTKTALSAGTITSYEAFFTGDLGKGVMIFGAIAIVGVFNSRLMWYFGNRWNHSMRFANQRELNEHRISLDIGRYRSKRFDDLTTQVDDIPGSWASRTLFADQLMALLSSFVSCITFGIALLAHSPFYFAGIFTVTLALVYGNFKIVNLWWHTYAKQTPFSKRRGLLERAYIREEPFVQAHMFNQAPALRQEIDRNVSHIKKMYETVRRETFGNQLLCYLLGIFVLLIVTAHVMWSTAIGDVSLGALTVLIASAKQFQSGVENFVSLLADQWNTARGVILIEKDFMGMTSALKTERPVDIPFVGVPRISIERLCFAYPDQDALVLKDISLVIEPGMKLAIVGKSGSGKSSLFALLARHYDPSSGSITVNGVPLNQIEPSVWFRYISGLTQDYAILDRTVEDEIGSSRLGEPLDRERVREAGLSKLPCWYSRTGALSKI